MFAMLQVMEKDLFLCYSYNITVILVRFLCDMSKQKRNDTYHARFQKND